MTIVYIILLLLAPRPLYLHGRGAYLALQAHDHSRLKASLLFLSMTVAVVIGMIVVTETI
jgi:hypothetical protein